MNVRRDFGVETVSKGGRGTIRPSRQLLSCIESLAIAKKLKTFHGRDITVGGVEAGEVVLRRGLMISNIRIGQTDLRGEGLYHQAGRTS